MNDAMDRVEHAKKANRPKREGAKKEKNDFFLLSNMIFHA